MEQPLNKILELYCVQSYCGYAGHLVIKCSKNNDLLLNDTQEPQWQFETVSAAWRLIENEILLTGSYESEEHNDNYLRLLIGKKIVGIKNSNLTDFSLIFQDSFKIETFNQGLDFPPLELYNIVDKTCLILNPRGKWEMEKENFGFTEEEKLQNAHAEQTHNRWKKNVPKESFDNHCERCAYFLSTSGRFYFWDYGICSNKKSVYDGSVVGVRSTCEHFDFELSTEN